jgi:hypothetical protein
MALPSGAVANLSQARAAAGFVRDGSNRWLAVDQGFAYWTEDAREEGLVLRRAALPDAPAETVGPLPQEEGWSVLPRGVRGGVVLLEASRSTYNPLPGPPLALVALALGLAVCRANRRQPP